MKAILICAFSFISLAAICQQKAQTIEVKKVAAPSQNIKTTEPQQAQPTVEESKKVTTTAQSQKSEEDARQGPVAAGHLYKCPKCKKVYPNPGKCPGDGAELTKEK